MASGLGLLLALGGIYHLWPRLPVEPYSLDSLRPGEREAMAWIAANTAADERFLVLSNTWSWEQDMAAEWFPVLAQRQSVLTPQGAEWLPDQLYARKVCLFQRARDLAAWNTTLSDLDTWASERGVVFSAIYISKAVRGNLDWSHLVASAESSPSYTVLLDTPDAAVLQRNAPVQPRWSESGQLVTAADCQSLADQTPQVIATFDGRFGQQAALAWVGEHERELPARASLTSLLGQVAAAMGGPRV
jgi:hypothetical protein